MTESAPQQHVDQRVLVYYGDEFDEADRLVGRSGQGVLEFERTQSIIRELLAPRSRIVDIGGGTGTHAAARTLARAFEAQPGLRDLSPRLLATGRTPRGGPSISR